MWSSPQFPADLVTLTDEMFNRKLHFLYIEEYDPIEQNISILSKLENRDYNAKIDGKNLFDQPRNHDTKTHENIRKIAIGHGDDYTTGCFLNYFYFKDNYKVIAIDLSE